MVQTDLKIVGLSPQPPFWLLWHINTCCRGLVGYHDKISHLILYVSLCIIYCLATSVLSCSPKSAKYGATNVKIAHCRSQQYHLDAVVKLSQITHQMSKLRGGGGEERIWENHRYPSKQTAKFKFPHILKCSKRNDFQVKYPSGTVVQAVCFPNDLDNKNMAGCVDPPFSVLIFLWIEAVIWFQCIYHICEWIFIITIIFKWFRCIQWVYNKKTNILFSINEEYKTRWLIFIPISCLHQLFSLSGDGCLSNATVVSTLLCCPIYNFWCCHKNGTTVVSIKRHHMSLISLC